MTAIHKRPADQLTLENWLQENDAKLWVERPTLKTAKERFTTQTDVKVSAKDFRESIEDCCDLFFRRPFGRKRFATSLSERQWARARAFVKKHCETLKGEPQAFAKRLMWSHGLPSSDSVLNQLGIVDQSKLVEAKQ